MMRDAVGWGRYPKTRSRRIELRDCDEAIPFGDPGSFLAHGMGRSLGDSCLNDGNTLLDTPGLGRVLAFDSLTGRLHAEAGITFDAIIRLVLPHGWFLPVTPGTRFVSLGGAIANDVHGKNHHRAGTFGNHVLGFRLRRSDGSWQRCSPTENPEMFRATIGGLGLTGLITDAEIQLKPVVNSWIDSATIRYGSVDEFADLTAESERDHEYVVAWVDTCTTRAVGPGVLIRGNHNVDAGPQTRIAPTGPVVSVPVIPPFSLLNGGTLRAFNTAYYWGRPTVAKRRVPLGPFFYPLDALGAYHRLYGPDGMVQWQALVPSHEVARELLVESRRAGASFLSVMKVMGDVPSPGMLSFSGKGVTIALDFPFEAGILPVLDRLDDLVAVAGGRLYPAKDARMSGRNFRLFYPQWEEFVPFVDPKFSSSFWRRVMG